MFSNVTTTLLTLIDQYVKKFFDKLYTLKQILPTVPKRELLVVFLFLGKVSLNLGKRLYKSVSKSFCNAIKKLFFSPKIY